MFFILPLPTVGCAHRASAPFARTMNASVITMYFGAHRASAAGGPYLRVRQRSHTHPFTELILFITCRLY